MNLERLKTAVWSYAIKNQHPNKETEFYYDTVRDAVVAFPDSTIVEFNEFENQETVVEETVPQNKQRDLFDRHEEDLDYLWDRFVEKVNDENS